MVYEKPYEQLAFQNLWKAPTSYRSASFVLGSKKQSWKVRAVFMKKSFEALKTCVLNTGFVFWEFITGRQNGVYQFRK